jgi:hypothetical protein
VGRGLLACQRRLVDDRDSSEPGSVRDQLIQLGLDRPNRPKNKAANRRQKY